MTKIAAIIVAAGRGTRAGTGLPKTYRMHAGKSVLRRTIDCFASHPKIQHIQVVINAGDVDLYDQCVDGLSLPPAVFGGDTRAQSVNAGMKALAGFNPDYVLIHDGARPFISSDVIDRVIKALENSPAAIPALPVADALWQTKNGKLVSPIPRDGVVRAQTPQGFQYKAYAEISSKFPDALDDAQAAIAAGLEVAWVDGDAQNVKLTFPEDFEAQT